MNGQNNPNSGADKDEEPSSLLRNKPLVGPTTMKPGQPLKDGQVPR
jgi:hypothetical protein